MFVKFNKLDFIFAEIDKNKKCVKKYISILVNCGEKVYSLKG